MRVCLGSQVDGPSRDPRSPHPPHYPIQLPPHTTPVSGSEAGGCCVGWACCRPYRGHRATPARRLWDAIARSRAPSPSRSCNGDIWEAADAVRLLDTTGADGIVVGRGCLGRPVAVPQPRRGLRRPARPRPPAARARSWRRCAGTRSCSSPPTASCPRCARSASTSRGTSRASPSAARPRRPSVRSARWPSSTPCSRRSTSTSRSPRRSSARRAGVPSAQRRVALPDGWLEDPEDPAVPAGAEMEVSGG
jgi:hypothetical protein